MTLKEFNKLAKNEAKQKMFICCGSNKFAALMMKHFPFKTEQSILDNATRIWYEECSLVDWLEALTHHPKIGDILTLTKKFAATAKLAGEEQAGMKKSSLDLMKAMKFTNEAYEEQNGFIFIVSASGKSSHEMLRLMVGRLFNSKEEEIDIAMGEQHKITIIRLKKLVDWDGWNSMPPSQITTHVLDTSTGKPGYGMAVRLKDMWKGSWQTIAQGETNADGRLSDLLPSGKILEEGSYQLVFETGDYFKNNKMEGFYPSVEIQFTISDNQHYHVPLLLNPFGYTTYRGS